MAKIVEHRDILLDDLVIGQGQVRVDQPGADIDILAKSIEVQGLLQPIVVCAARQAGKWEVLAGQRRVLAHKLLKLDTIAASILDERVEGAEAKAISITENLIRRKLTGKELKEGILFLYNRYGSISDVAQATGLPRKLVGDYVKYPRLIEELKQLVDNQQVDINAALRAQDSAIDDKGEINKEVALQLAEEIKLMPGVQRDKFSKIRQQQPDKPIEDVLEDAKSGEQVIQIVATVTRAVHSAVQSFAKEEEVNTQDEAVAMLIEEALVGRGLLEE